MLIDLQVHSDYSDGYMTPSELVEYLAARQVKVAALTDHNTVGGQEEFRHAAHKAGIKAVTGLELYTRLNSRRFNILWYNFDPHNPELHQILRESQFRRRRKVRSILEELTVRGFKIKIDQVVDKYNHYVPINRIVDELMAVPANAKLIRKELRDRHPREEDIVRHYFYNSRHGMMRESYIDIKRIIRLRKKIGGQLVLCHPAKHGRIRKDLFVKLKKLGVDGIEVLSPHHTYGAVMYLQAIAGEMDYIETGGTDFHRLEGKGNSLQHPGQYFTIDSRLLRGVGKIIG